MLAGGSAAAPSGLATTAGARARARQPLLSLAQFGNLQDGGFPRTDLSLSGYPIPALWYLLVKDKFCPLRAGSLSPCPTSCHCCAGFKTADLWDGGILVGIWATSTAAEKEETFYQDNSAEAISHLIVHALSSSNLLIGYLSLSHQFWLSAAHLLWFNLAGGKAPHSHSLTHPLPSGMGERIGKNVELVGRDKNYLLR